MREARTLVTGGTGFIGRHLVERLVSAGTGVTALVRADTSLPTTWPAQVAAIPVADWSLPGLRAVLGSSQFGMIYHLAAYGVRPGDRDVAQMLAVNVELATSLVQLAAERGAAVVTAGSSAEYASPAGTAPLDERQPLETSRLYGASKAAGGLMAAAAASALGVRLRHLRLFNIYGPGEAAHRLLPSLVVRLSRGERVAMSEGLQVRDFVLVDDAVDALLAAGREARQSNNAGCTVWNVCSGEGRSVRDFAITAAEALGRPSALLGFGDLPLRPDEIGWLVGSNRSIRDDLGWRPRHGFMDGVQSAALRLMHTLEDGNRAA